MREALHKEINVMKSLNNEHIVKCLDVIPSKRYTYIVLEFCPDGDLTKYL